MTDQWASLVSAAYDEYLENQLRSAAEWAQLWPRSNDEWLAQQTRRFRIRYRIRRKVVRWWYGARQATADWIFPEGRSYE